MEFGYLISGADTKNLNRSHKVFTAWIGASSIFLALITPF